MGKLGARVTDIISHSSGRHSIVSAQGKVIARHVLIAGLPPPLLLGIRVDPPLPAELVQLLERYPLGTSLKYSLVFKTPFWRALGYLGKIILYNSTESGYTVECL